MNRGYALILSGYIGWGLFPLYWQLLAQVAALEVLLHRMMWSVPVLLLLVLLSKRRRSQVKTALRSWLEVRWLMVSGLVICLNWGIYIWAVANQRVVEASMGYFLTPLLNVLAGVLIFRERLDRVQIVAIIFAAIGVTYYVLSTDAIPWVGLSVGISFATYGLLRKQMQTNAIPGLMIETLMLLPFTLALIAWLHHGNQASFLNHSSNIDWLLILGGPVTIIPLALFTAGTRLLPMSTVGILFYVTPSLQFMAGVFILGEAFNVDKLISFVGIWIGLAIFSYHLLSGRSDPETAAT